jgi:hypothetical protein
LCVDVCFGFCYFSLLIVHIKSYKSGMCTDCRFHSFKLSNSLLNFDVLISCHNIADHTLNAFTFFMSVSTINIKADKHLYLFHKKHLLKNVWTLTTTVCVFVLKIIFAMFYSSPFLVLIHLLFKNPADASLLMYTFLLFVTICHDLLFKCSSRKCCKSSGSRHYSLRLYDKIISRDYNKTNAFVIQI